MKVSSPTETTYERYTKSLSERWEKRRVPTTPVVVTCKGKTPKETSNRLSSMLSDFKPFPSDLDPKRKRVEESASRYRTLQRHDEIISGVVNSSSRQGLSLRGCGNRRSLSSEGNGKSHSHHSRSTTTIGTPRSSRKN